MPKFKVSNETLVGALATVSVTILLLGYNFLKGEELFTTTTNYYAAFDNALNLQSSAPVMYRGIKVGSVRKIQFLPNAQGVVVQFYVNDRVKMPVSSKVRLISTDLFNTRALELAPSDDWNAPLHKKNDTIPGEIGAGLMDKLEAELGPTLKNVESVTAELNRVLKALESSKLQNTMQSLESTTAGLDKLINDPSSRLNKMLANVQSISQNLKNNQEVLNAALANINAITDSLAKAELTSTVFQARLALEQTTQVMEKINKGEGTVGMLVNDKALYENLNRTAADLDKLMIDMRENPKRYVHFSVFGRKGN
jgi:phospholipid/cholesterol/gamma-HCH transport system substrate-binding protein